MSDENKTDPSVIAHIRRRRGFEQACEARGRLETTRTRMEEDQAEAAYAETAPTTEWGAELHTRIFCPPLPAVTGSLRQAVASPPERNPGPGARLHADHEFRSPAARGRFRQGLPR